MLKLAILAVVAVAAFAAPASDDDFVLKFEPQNNNIQSTVDAQWELFKVKHGKTYESSGEEARRKEIFSRNVKHIEMHNYMHDKGYESYQLEINHFADMEVKEFASIMNGLKPRNNSLSKFDRLTYLSPAMPVSVPDSLDWRDHGYVTPVKNQGQCGSCWSFSTTGSLEGQHFRKSGKLVSLSEQNLVDCSGGQYHNEGCNGGLMDNAFQYIKDNGGIDTEDSYPYLAVQGTCHYSADNRGATDAGFVDVEHGDEDKLKEALATIGPISVAIDAAHQSFQLYKGGVYVEPECSSTQLDHGVLAVGYGTEDGQDYWLVKNSWGEEWGDQGYIKMARNKDNQCGVASMASYPLV